MGQGSPGDALVEVLDAPCGMETFIEPLVLTMLLLMYDDAQTASAWAASLWPSPALS
jgi:hypothetical protein